MINNENIIRLSLSRLRRIKLVIRVENSEVIEANEIVEAQIYSSIGSENSVSMGSVNSAMFKATFKYDASRALNGAYVIPTIYVYDDAMGEVYSMDMGVFYITDISTSSDFSITSITAYDRMANLTGLFTPSVSMPCSIRDVVNDICSKYNINCITELDDIEIGYIENLTDREMIGQIAGLMGANAIINKDGNLEFRWYKNTDDVSIGLNNITKNGFKKTSSVGNGVYSINSLISGTEDNLLVSGSGRALKYYNYYMTQERLDLLKNLRLPLSYAPSVISYQGCPCIEVGDIVEISENNQIYPVIVSKHILSFKHGVLTGEITSLGESSEKSEVTKDTREIRELLRLKTNLERAFEEATELILGLRGGYFELMVDQNTGRPSGWMIRDTPTLTATTKLWQFSLGGLVFSNDGGQTFSNVAIDMNGNIVANAITAGVMSSERIYIGEEDDVLGRYLRVKRDEDENILLEIGNESNQIKLIERSNEVGFYVKKGEEWESVAKFTPTGLVFSDASFTGLDLREWAIEPNENVLNFYHRH